MQKGQEQDMKLYYIVDTINPINVQNIQKKQGIMDLISIKFPVKSMQIRP